MDIAVQLEPIVGAPPAVAYRWDADTDILTARLDGSVDGTGASGSVEVESGDGAWIILDVVKGRIFGLEVAVWPDVRTRATLTPPPAVEDAHVRLPMDATQPGAGLLEIETTLLAECDESERVVHFRLGGARGVRTVRPGRDFLIDLDPHSRIAGLWLLNVPPFPPT